MPALAIPRLLVILVALVVILGVLASISLIYLPQATIAVYPATTLKSVSHVITLTKTANAPDFVRFILPAKVVKKSLEESQTITRSVGPVHDDLARGTVVLRNNQADEQPLLAQTHLRHEATGTFFLLDKAVRIPPQGTSTVTVTAQDKGQAGNVPKGKFIVDKLPTSLQAVVYGESEQDFTGGVAGSTPLTEEDINQAKAGVEQKAKERATAELSTSLRPDLINFSIDSEAISAAVGSFSPSYTISIQATARGFAIDATDLLSLTVLALRAQGSAETELASYDPNSFKVAIQQANFERGEASIIGTVTGTFTAKISPTVFDVSNLSGRTTAEVEEYFKQFPGVDHVAVSLSPFWVKTVPSRTSAIEITIKSRVNH